MDIGMTLEEITINNLDAILAQSAASEDFKQAVRHLNEGNAQDQITWNAGSPAVKVLRFVMKLLEAYNDLEIESLKVTGQAGCSDYAGEATAHPGDIRFEFEWNCAWRAEERGWEDAFGDPDQIRAAQTFGYQCFRRLEKI